MGSAIGGIAGMVAGGGGGNAPNAPNLSGNISNAQNTYNTATGNAAQTFNTAQAYNQNAQNTLANTVGSNTQMMNNVNNSANQNLQQYGSTFSPLQAQQAQQAKNYTSDQNVQQLQGQAVANSNSAQQAALQNQRAQLASEGVDPSSVHGAALGQEAAIQGAAQNAGAATNSYLQTQATGAQLVNQANQLGMQVGAQGAQQAGLGSQMGTANVQNTNSTNSTGINNMTAANQYLNTGVNANQSAANIAGQQFGMQQTAYQDQQQAAANKGSMIGNIVGGTAAMAFMEHGGQVSEHGALPMPVVPGTTDRKVVALTPGEFVIPKPVAEYKGHAFFHNLIDKAMQEIHERHGLPMPEQMDRSAHVHRGV